MSQSVESDRKRFAVVYFPQSNEFSELPSMWLNNDSTCWWPVHLKNISSLMRMNVQPDPDTWRTYPCEVKLYTDDFNKARQRAELGEFNSTDEEILGRGKRKKKTVTTRYSSDSNDSNTSSEGAPAIEIATSENVGGNEFIDISEERISISANDLGIQTLFINPNNDGHVASQEIDKENRITEETPVLLNYADELTCATTSTAVMKPSILDDIKQICLSTNVLVRDIESRLINLQEQSLRKIETNIGIREEVLQYLPIATVAELNLFEQKLNDEAFLQKFKSLLLNVGGRNGKDNITRCLKAVYSNSFAVGCSWLGHRNNYKVCNLPTMAIIKSVILSSYNDIKLADFEQISSEWFRLAKLRLSRETKLQEKQQGDN